MRKGHKKVEFIMDTDWIFQGIIDAEQKQYILLNYFQKLNKHLENMEVYPMFIELSLHLGNIQTLINQNKILYTHKKFLTNDDELLISDLKTKDIPTLSEEEIVEYHQILSNSQPQLFDYFGFAKSIWSIVYDSISVNIKKNKNNIKSKNGFFYFKTDNDIYVWKYTIKRVYKTKGQTKTTTKLIYFGPHTDLTITDILSKFSKNYKTDDECKFPLFEIESKNIFPIEETLLPISKRKIISFIAQHNKVKQLSE